MAKTFNDYLRSKIAANPQLAVMIEQEAIHSHIAQQVYDLRTQAGLSQKALADLIGSKQSVISRIEDSDYDGHSINMLERIARALGMKVRVEFYKEIMPTICGVQMQFESELSTPKEREERAADALLVSLLRRVDKDDDFIDEKYLPQLTDEDRAALKNLGSDLVQRLLAGERPRSAPR